MPAVTGRRSTVAALRPSSEFTRLDFPAFTEPSTPSVIAFGPVAVLAAARYRRVAHFGRGWVGKRVVGSSMGGG